MRVHLAAVGLLIGLSTPQAPAAEPLRREKIAVGKELFLREWVPGDPRARGGDGLGPVYNASSCVECHSQGGIGGAGTNERNAEVISAEFHLNKDEDPKELARDLLLKAHPGFGLATTLNLHAKGVDPSYAGWRADLKCHSYGRFRIGVGHRNTPALFGSGLIDAIPEAEILAMVRKHHAEAPEVQGRVSRLPDGKLGRFGWKAQMPSLDEFVRTACAVELGLEVPGHPQSPDPRDLAAKPPGLDLSDAECSALVAFVDSLPEPGRRVPMNLDQAGAEAQGERIFDSVGCAACHTPRVGDVQGLYSDLLLHDMGAELVSAGGGYGLPQSPSTTLADRTSKGDPAIETEWRTPPLWGVRDSAPYLHDGRAPSLEAAILAHRGEAATTLQRFSKLTPAQKTQVHAFLNSLAAPRPEKATKPEKPKKAAGPPRAGSAPRGSVTFRFM